MSIYVYVTRKSDPFDPDGPSISLDEWRQLVVSDPDLLIADAPDRAPSDKTVYAVWRTYPGGYPAWFGLEDGNIEVKGLDDTILIKLRQFAGGLDGRIVSEEGEAFS